MDNRTQEKVVSKGRSRDPRRAADAYSESALEKIIVLFRLGYAALQSKGKQRTELRELSEQNSELSKKLRAATKRPVELQREVQKSPIKGWWEASMDQLSLEELKLHKRMSEELSKMLTQEIEDRTTISHGNNSDDPCGTDS
ncbi:hypothetical protein EUGRSUZ_H00198 [Eucalyptus grandis]|uniref:Uncharacterized protein n=2 Tax=Eucalyptus grandis TaxID=71139 RepID=A0ACC3JMP3_EUCGR|nr:hypothetical protein EUGRSUZ_H00198 [Eucalyptus grandis]